MPIGLDDAIWGWLVASAGNAFVRRARGDRARSELRKVIRQAVDETVAEFAHYLNPQQATHLREVLLNRETSLGEEPVSTLSDLRAALGNWVRTLDVPELGGVGYLSEIGVDSTLLAAELTRRIGSGVDRNGRSDGPLRLFADWWWRDEAIARLDRIEGGVVNVRGPASVARRGALPGVTPNFTGRAEEFAELRRRVVEHDPSGVVVAIHALDGMAGVGKTAFAVYAAHRFKDRYPDGHYFVDLHGYTPNMAPMRPAAALERLLTQAGVPGAAMPANLVDLQEHWRASMAGQRALVLLDNALDARQVEPLLPLTPGCLVLITSRVRLVALPVARSLSLDVPGTAEAAELFARIAGRDLVGGSVEVGRAVGLVGHLPLAVEMIAGRLRGDATLTVEELADDLVDATGRLTETSPPRAGVRAALAMSERRLPARSREVFLAVGLHPGTTVGVPQLAAILGHRPDEIARVLRDLTVRNLITPRRERLGHRRYQLHDLVWDFVREEADRHFGGPDRRAALARLSNWYVDALDAFSDTDGAAVDAPAATVLPPAGLTLKSPSEERQWLLGEQDNLLALSRVALGEGSAKMYTRAAWHLYKLSAYAPARQLHQAAASAYDEAGSRAGYADSLRGLGHAALGVGDYLPAREYFRQAADIFGELGDRAAYATTIRDLGQVIQFIGDYASAHVLFQEAADLFKELEDTVGYGYCQYGLAFVSLGVGAYPAARRYLDGMPEVFNDPMGRGHIRYALGLIALGDSEPETAREHFEAVRRDFRSIDNRSGDNHADYGLGLAALSAGDYRTARDHLRAAADVFEEMVDRSAYAHVVRGMGFVALEAGDHDVAQRHFDQALAIYGAIGCRSGYGDTRRGLGFLALYRGDYVAARTELRAAGQVFEEIGKSNGSADVCWGLGAVAEADGDLTAARDHWSEAMSAYECMSSPLVEKVRAALDDLGSRPGPGRPIRRPDHPYPT
nr:tetratricopeptide repeat protein [Micromonospora sp. DSM 115978]